MLIGTPTCIDCWAFEEVVQELVFQIIPKCQQRWRSFSEPGSSQAALSVGADRAGWKFILVSSHRSTDVNGKGGVSHQDRWKQNQCRPHSPDEVFSISKIRKKFYPHSSEQLQGKPKQALNTQKWHCSVGGGSAEALSLFLSRGNEPIQRNLWQTRSNCFST